jgi:hypothetical protein
MENVKEWRCFHCDEVFTDAALAREHFGSDEYEMFDPPGCVDPLRTDEKARLKELRDAREHAIQMQHEANENAEAVGTLESFRSEIGRYFGESGGSIASTPHQAWLKLEAAQNEAAMWKQKFEAVQPQEPVPSNGNSFSQNKAIRSTFPDPGELAQRLLGPAPYQVLVDKFEAHEAIRAFQRDTINTLADCLVHCAVRLEATNNFITTEDLKREAQALRDYAETLRPAAPEVNR